MIGRHDPLADPRALIPKLYRYVAYVIGDGPDAEDVTSEAFERALRYRDSYDPKRGSPLTWLVGIAARCISDRGAVLARAPVPTAEMELHAGTADDFTDEATLRLRVATVLGELSERDRELVALRYGADLTAREVGAHLGLTTNAAEVALHRLNRRLRSELAELDRPPPSKAVEPERKGLDAPAGI
ncbi:MAG TPA: sigma-70 family RNA polymerase sigma factor [Gaiellaceae bacterium]|nr:sigma-70 family RNA polymerase sigma factor [Gaiellaceae bacterium]